MVSNYLSDKTLNCDATDCYMASIARKYIFLVKTYYFISLSLVHFLSLKSISLKKKNNFS